MADASSAQPNNFFQSIPDDQKIENPFAADEIVFRDAAGALKVLRNGKTYDFDGEMPTDVPQPMAVKPVEAAEIRPPAPPVMAVAKPVTVPLGQPLDIEKEVDNVIKQSALTLTKDDDQRKFRNIIMSRLRDIRDPVQTREALLESVDKGGMGFDEQTSERILRLLSDEVEQFHGKKRQEVSSQPFADLQAEASKILTEPELIIEPPTIVFHPPQTATPAAPLPASTEVIAEKKPVAPPPPPPSISRPSDTATFERPKIEDVKFEPRLTGPTEEIRTMTVADFRRLAPSPQLAAEKIFEKINLLEEESFTQRNQAIRAWKQSDVNRLYLAMGDQSMEEHKTITDIIAERKQANQPVLSEDELEAVFELNKKLRY